MMNSIRIKRWGAEFSYEYYMFMNSSDEVFRNSTKSNRKIPKRKLKFFVKFFIKSLDMSFEVFFICMIVNVKQTCEIEKRYSLFQESCPKNIHIHLWFSCNIVCKIMEIFDLLSLLSIFHNTFIILFYIIHHRVSSKS